MYIHRDLLNGRRNTTIDQKSMALESHIHDMFQPRKFHCRRKLNQLYMIQSYWFTMMCLTELFGRCIEEP